MTVTRPLRWASGTTILPARTRGIWISPWCRSIGWKAADAEAVAKSATPSAKGPTRRRTERRVAVGSARGTIRGQARADHGRREQAIDRVGDRQAPRGRGSRAGLHLSGRADRGKRAGTGVLSGLA